MCLIDYVMCSYVKFASKMEFKLNSILLQFQQLPSIPSGRMYS